MKERNQENHMNYKNKEIREIVWGKRKGNRKDTAKREKAKHGKEKKE